MSTPSDAASERLRSAALAGKPKPYVMAHRGNRVACPENTVAAFRQAVADGADIVETDLHLSADDEFVCIHDATVDRSTNGTGAVADMTASDIRSLSASGGRPGFEGERVPFLKEVASVLRPDTVLAVELKIDRFLDPGVCRRLVAEFDDLGIRERVIALSFSLGRLRSLNAVAADVPVGWITVLRPWPSHTPHLLGPAWPLLLANPLYVSIAHSRRQLVCPLDPRPDSRLSIYRWLGCDAVLTDDPAATCRALKRVGPEQT